MSIREQVIKIVHDNGLTHSDEPVALASGELSCDFVDCKAALAHGKDLKLACTYLLDEVAKLGVEFDAIGGLTMGADQFAHAVAVLADKDWFVVRKESKGYGTNKIIEGAEPRRDTRVLLVDDVVTTGGSIQRAYHEVAALGPRIVAAVTLVDRGDTAAVFFAQRDIPYVALVTYDDLSIKPVGSMGGLVSA